MHLLAVFLFGLMTVSAHASESIFPPPEVLMYDKQCDEHPDPRECEFQQKTFPEDYRKAIAGDYQGQRNVAYCLDRGCAQTVGRRPVDACAWRMVILAANHARTLSSDVHELGMTCGPHQLGDKDRQYAEIKARKFYLEIYGARPDPWVWEAVEKMLR